MNDDIVLGLNDYFQRMQEQTGAFATALSASVKQYASTGENLVSGTEESAKVVVDTLTKAYQDAASWGEAYARGAAEASNPNAAAQMQKWADVMNAKAASLANEATSALSKVDAMNSAVNKVLSEAISPEWREIKGIGAKFDGFSLLTAAINGDSEEFYKNSVGIIASEAAALVTSAVLTFFGAPVLLTALAAGAAAYGAAIFAEDLYNAAKPGFAIIGDAFFKWLDPNGIYGPFSNAKNWVQRRDPLTFDLDGDGLETIGASTTNPILFDHDGDGIKNGTGWVKPDDAFLVLDKNGNGTIDNGLELFGDSTVKSNGQKATDGFDALADLDANHDGVVNAADAQFANLKLWRDLNQDGVSQSDELFTLSSQHVVGINVANIEHSQVLPNGNELADKGTFIKDDGSQGEVGAVTGDLGDINLADDTFNRTFPDKLDTSSVANLPDMQGSGKVRDLREAVNDELIFRDTKREGALGYADWRVAA